MDHAYNKLKERRKERGRMEKNTTWKPHDLYETLSKDTSCVVIIPKLLMVTLLIVLLLYPNS